MKPLICIILIIAPLTLAPAFSHADADAPGGTLKAIELSVPESGRSIPFMSAKTLDAPPGFRVSLFASDLGGVRFMAEGPDGVIYATVPSDGAVIALPDKDRDGAADEKAVFASNLKRPHGIAFLGKDMVIAATGGIVLLRDTDKDLKADIRKIISDDLPEGGGHWTRTVAAGPDGYLYVSAGSSCNACEEKDPRRAAVLRFKSGGGKGEVFAGGLRNSVGIAFEPNTKELWGVDNGRDWLGENLPPEELNRIVMGGDYGWPYCYGDKVPDPDLGAPKRCSSTVAPEVKMQAHSAPLGMAFGYGLKFPASFKDVLYVAFHGSWNRLVPTGYKLIGIPFKNGRPSGEPFDFIAGWMRGGVVWGRPAGVLAGSDGALYVSDDYAGAIYRITAEEAR